MTDPGQSEAGIDDPEYYEQEDDSMEGMYA
jgi:hypothetical protein